MYVQKESVSRPVPSPYQHNAQHVTALLILSYKTIFVPSLCKRNEGGGGQQAMPGVHTSVSGNFLTFCQQLLLVPGKQIHPIPL